MPKSITEIAILAEYHDLATASLQQAGMLIRLLRQLHFHTPLS